MPVAPPPARDSRRTRRANPANTSERTSVATRRRIAREGDENLNPLSGRRLAWPSSMLPPSPQRLPEAVPQFRVQGVHFQVPASLPIAPSPAIPPYRRTRGSRRGRVRRPQEELPQRLTETMGDLTLSVSEPPSSIR